MKKNQRSRVMKILIARTLMAAVAMIFGTAGFAQNYPARAVRMIVPFAPGGGTDILVRTIAPRVAEALGQQLVIDNRAGGGSTIGTDLAAKSPPDGYTLLAVDSAFTTNPSLYTRLPYDTTRDFSPVSLLAAAPVILIVHPSVPV